MIPGRAPEADLWQAGDCRRFAWTASGGTVDDINPVLPTTRNLP